MKQKNPTDLVSLRPNIKFMVYNSDIETLVRAVKERLFFVTDGKGGFVEPPRPESLASFVDGMDEFFKQFKKYVKYVAPLTKDQFLGAYAGRRKAIYKKALNSLLNFPLTRKDSRISFFPKTEKNNFTAKSDPVPRGISPRHARYHVSLGPYIKRIEHEVYDIIGKVFGAPTVFKGLNAARRGAQLLAHWNHFDDPVAIPLDASRFDQHVSKEALTWEHSVYKLFFPKDKRFEQLLSWQLVNKGYGRAENGKIKFTLVGKRMSGDMNTALGNCLLMCAKVYCYMMSVKVRKFRLANDGDDCVLIIESRDFKKIATLDLWFLKKGFNMKIGKPVKVLEEIEFCQSHPVRTPQGCLMVRKYPVSVSKDCLSIKPLNSEKLFKRWIKAVGEGGISLTGGIPIVQEFYACLLRNSGNVKALTNDPTQDTGLSRLAAGMKREYSPVDSYTRLSFWRAFGVDPARQIALEQVYRMKTLCYDSIRDPNDNLDMRL